MYINEYKYIYSKFTTLDHFIISEYLLICVEDEEVGGWRGGGGRGTMLMGQASRESEIVVCVCVCTCK